MNPVPYDCFRTQAFRADVQNTLVPQAATIIVRRIMKVIALSGGWLYARLRVMQLIISNRNEEARVLHVEVPGRF